MKRTMMVAVLACAGAFGIEPIKTGSKVYIAPAENGFDTYLSAALVKKRVPVTVIADKTQADYELQAAAESHKAGWAKIIFAGDLRSSESASIRLVNLKTSEVIYSYAYNAGSSWRGKQSAAESAAKHLAKAKIWIGEGVKK